MALIILGSIALGDWIALHHGRAARLIQVCLLASIIAIEAVGFSALFVRGADAVSATPGWVWLAFVCYGGGVMGVVDRLSHHTALGDKPLY